MQEYDDVYDKFLIATLSETKICVWEAVHLGKQVDLVSGVEVYVSSSADSSASSSMYTSIRGQWCKVRHHNVFCVW